MTGKRLALIVIAGCGLLLALSIAYAGYDRDGAGAGEHYGHSEGSEETIPAVTQALYVAECGSCHFAYQPGWLPARSWKKMMGELDQHFGDNAELDQQSRKAITDYLMMEAADQTNNRMSKKILRSVASTDAPQRISTLAYFVHEHDEIPQRFVQGNNKVKSITNCLACHGQAEKGRFDEEGVSIPGYGRWDD